jgi:uncharacterized oxidoreductase
MVDAHLHGHPSHGVQLIPRYHKWLKNGVLKRSGVVNVEKTSENSLKVDATKSFGHWALPEIIRKSANLSGKIKSFEIANLGHTGYVAGCLREADIKDHIVMLWINTSGSRLASPYNGSKKLMSTSVLAASVPGVYVMDMSTTSTAENSVHHAMMSRKDLDVNLILPNGNFTRNPRELYVDTPNGLNPLMGQTAIAFDNHKLYGVGLLAEILAGVLSGSGTSQGTSFHSGCFGILIKVDTDFISQASSYLDWIKAEPTVRVPGDKNLSTIELQPWENEILADFKEKRDVKSEIYITPSNP